MQLRRYLKVSKSRKQILKFSFEPENERIYFCISALAYKKRSNQKSSVSQIKILQLAVGSALIFLFDLFLEAREEIKKSFVFGSNENLKICFRDLLTFNF